MSDYSRPISRYPLFQIPFIFLILFLLTTALIWFLGIGKPNVAVTIALDLSSSTYPGNQFNAPDSVMDQEIRAVKAYLEKNESGILRQPNLVKVLGFASIPMSLTNNFESDAAAITGQINQALQNPKLPQNLGGGTDIDLAVQESIQMLAQIDDRCRELLLVTDGVGSVSTGRIDQAIAENVRIHAIVIGTNAPEVEKAVIATEGTYIAALEDDNLEELFTQRFFTDFNNNWPWIILSLGLAWMALMWTLTMPLDRWLFQGLFRLPINFAGRLALSNALFWTVATPGILVGIYRLLNLASPFTSAC